MPPEWATCRPAPARGIDCSPRALRGRARRAGPRDWAGGGAAEGLRLLCSGDNLEAETAESALERRPRASEPLCSSSSRTTPEVSGEQKLAGWLAVPPQAPSPGLMGHPGSHSAAARHPGHLGRGGREEAARALGLFFPKSDGSASLFVPRSLPPLWSHPRLPAFLPDLCSLPPPSPPPLASLSSSVILFHSPPRVQPARVPLVQMLSV